MFEHISCLKTLFQSVATIEIALMATRQVQASMQRTLVPIETRDICLTLENDLEFQYRAVMDALLHQIARSVRLRVDQDVAAGRIAPQQKKHEGN